MSSSGPSARAVKSGSQPPHRTHAWDSASTGSSKCSPGRSRGGLARGRDGGRGAGDRRVALARAAMSGALGGRKPGMLVAARGARSAYPRSRHGAACVVAGGEVGLAGARWCPYEAALALADADAEEPLRQASDELQAHGARPATTIVARKLRERGVRGVPHGPRAHAGESRRPPCAPARGAGTTCQGLRNAAVASTAGGLEKSVDHHASAILRKLEVRTPGEAAADAARLRLDSPRWVAASRNIGPPSDAPGSRRSYVLHSIPQGH
jgi:hypothetical protein